MNRYIKSRLNLDKMGIKFGLSNVIQHKGLTNDLLIEFIDSKGFTVNYLDYTYSNCNYHTLNRDKNSSIEVLITNYTM
jgi:DNA adenine methylase